MKLRLDPPHVRNDDGRIMLVTYDKNWKRQTGNYRYSWALEPEAALDKAREEHPEIQVTRNAGAVLLGGEPDESAELLPARMVARAAEDFAVLRKLFEMTQIGIVAALDSTNNPKSMPQFGAVVDFAVSFADEASTVAIEKGWDHA